MAGWRPVSSPHACIGMAPAGGSALSGVTPAPAVDASGGPATSWGVIVPLAHAHGGQPDFPSSAGASAGCEPCTDAPLQPLVRQPSDLILPIRCAHPPLDKTRITTESSLAAALRFPSPPPNRDPPSMAIPPVLVYPPVPAYPIHAQHSTRTRTAPPPDPTPVPASSPANTPAVVPEPSHAPVTTDTASPPSAAGHTRPRSHRKRAAPRSSASPSPDPPPATAPSLTGRQTTGRAKRSRSSRSRRAADQDSASPSPQETATSNEAANATASGSSGATPAVPCGPAFSPAGLLAYMKEHDRVPFRIVYVPVSGQKGRKGKTTSKRYGCVMCVESFDRPSTLRKHVLVHTREKNHACTHCARRFGVPSNLNRHMRLCAQKMTDAQTTPADTEPAAPLSSAAAGSASTSAATTAGGDLPTDSAATASEPATTAEVDASAEGSAQPAKRRRRPRDQAPPWIPASLARFNLAPCYKLAPLPLPPVRPWGMYVEVPGEPGEDGPRMKWVQVEERDSYDETMHATPYHPKYWKGRLPGPRALVPGGVVNLRVSEGLNRTGTAPMA